MHILVSNDDGYRAPGIQALAQAMRRFGRVTVVAPDHNHSGASNSLTLNRPLTVEHQDGDSLYVLSGTPSDCVHVALTGLLPKPDLVVSGINCGANMGDDTMYSGTVAAAIEGYLRRSLHRLLADRQGLGRTRLCREDCAARRRALS